jgi:hypothetical protein
MDMPIRSGLYVMCLWSGRLALLRTSVQRALTALQIPQHGSTNRSSGESAAWAALGDGRYTARCWPSRHAVHDAVVMSQVMLTCSLQPPTFSCLRMNIGWRRGRYLQPRCSKGGLHLCRRHAAAGSCLGRLRLAGISSSKSAHLWSAQRHRTSRWDRFSPPSSACAHRLTSSMRMHFTLTSSTRPSAGQRGGGTGAHRDS